MSAIAAMVPLVIGSFAVGNKSGSAPDTLVQLQSEATTIKVRVILELSGVRKSCPIAIAIAIVHVRDLMGNIVKVVYACDDASHKTADRITNGRQFSGGFKATSHCRGSWLPGSSRDHTFSQKPTPCMLIGRD
jgi:hypothetical protein